MNDDASLETEPNEIEGGDEGTRYDEDAAENDPASPQHAGTAPLGAIEDVEVVLNCDIGSKRIRLAQLRSIQPGYIVELDTPLESPVRMTVNGAIIGHGELVQVDGKLAVRVIEESN